MTELEKETYEILSDLEALESFYKKDYIDLKTYYEIKKEILVKYVAIGEYYHSEVTEKIENDWWTDYLALET